MSIHFEKDCDRIVILTIDLKDSSSNILNNTFLDAFEAAVEKITADDGIEGVIITSAKQEFFAGTDLNWCLQSSNPESVYAVAERFKKMLRQLEILNKPTVAALNGSALGGGLEIALSCHYRVALNNPKFKFGFPGIRFGLIPGGGGTQRLPRLLGIQEALWLLLEGTKFSPQMALSKGLVNELAADWADLVKKTKNWIFANPFATQPWDSNRFQWPGIIGNPTSAEISKFWSIAPSAMNQKVFRNYPAPMKILACVHEGSLVDFDTACRIESRYFANCVIGSVAKNMIRAFWFQLSSIRKGEQRPTEIPRSFIQKIGVLGAGMMGSGIAYISAISGMEVILKDTTQELAESGKAYSAGNLEDQIGFNRIDNTRKMEVLSRIFPTDQIKGLMECDLIIENVFEHRNLKIQVMQETETYLKDSTVFATNTSSLSIDDLAQHSSRPENFIGIHFLSPVEKMRLVEIIVGEKTSMTTLAKAFDYVRHIGKIPIVINDGRGFYTSRVFWAYVLEGMTLLIEGNHPRAIESAGTQAGMPVGPLTLTDEISLGLVYQGVMQFINSLKQQKREIPEMPGLQVLSLMVNQLDRIGKKNGKGFYEYPKFEKKYLWPGLQEHFPSKTTLSQKEMMTRILFAQAIESVRCLEENVVTTVADANIGSLLGWGFPSFRGGTLQYINDYGIHDFVKEARHLTEQCGSRFSPPALLLKMAHTHQTFE
ncbi:MAG: enoyl-CoA hydratase/isomerase family protein [SAR324 cluster bacterium]|nr:enoyl-CoA hydratase/isomerase family protein [SAR324 cluster bacterium]